VTRSFPAAGGAAADRIAPRGGAASVTVTALPVSLFLQSESTMLLDSESAIMISESAYQYQTPASALESGLLARQRKRSFKKACSLHLFIMASSAAPAPVAALTPLRIRVTGAGNRAESGPSHRRSRPQTSPAGPARRRRRSGPQHGMTRILRGRGPRRVQPDPAPGEPPGQSESVAVTQPDALRLARPSHGPRWPRSELEVTARVTVFGPSPQP
jgi:hypothetical protein